MNKIKVNDEVNRSQREEFEKYICESNIFGKKIKERMTVEDNAKSTHLPFNRDQIRNFSKQFINYNGIL